MWDSITTWLQEYPGFLSVIGALILFFNWLISNTLQASYMSWKSSIEQADRHNCLSYMFAQIRDLLLSVTSEIWKPRCPPQNDQLIRGIENEYSGALDSMSRTRLNATRVNELNEFCIRELTFSRSPATVMNAAFELQQIQNESQQLFQRLCEAFGVVDGIIKEVQAMDPRPPDQVQRAITAINECEAAYRNEILPKVAPLCDRAVMAANKLRRDIYVELQSHQRRAKVFSSVAIWIYILGSIVVVAGQVGDKMLWKTNPEPNESLPTTEQILRELNHEVQQLQKEQKALSRIEEIDNELKALNQAIEKLNETPKGHKTEKQE